MWENNKKDALHFSTSREERNIAKQCADVLPSTSMYFASVRASLQPLPANKMQIEGIAAASELFLRNPQDLLLNSCKLGDASIFTQNHFDQISINAFQHLSRLEPWKALHFKDMCLIIFGFRSSDIVWQGVLTWSEMLSPYWAGFGWVANLQGI